MKLTEEKNEAEVAKRLNEVFRDISESNAF
jgi:hypothetical protein